MPDFDLSAEWERARALFPVLANYVLERKPLEGARVGECRLRRGVIVVEPGLTAAYAKKVLGHEITHARLDHGGHKTVFVRRLIETYLALGYFDAETAADLRAGRAGCGQVERAALAYMRGRAAR